MGDSTIRSSLPRPKRSGVTRSWFGTGTHTGAVCSPGHSPNPGHTAIAELEKHLAHVVVITQNIDGLHAAAGSTDVIAVHGDIRQNKCFANCQGDPTLIDVDELTWDREAGPPVCPHCGAYVRPNVVWFHELLPPAALERALAPEPDV